MLECFIVGDILVNDLPYQKDCKYLIRPDFVSLDFVNLDIQMTEKAGYVILSVSGNDKNLRWLEANLRDIRSHIRSDNVIWFLPVNETPARDITMKVALDNNDMLLDVRDYGAKPSGLNQQSLATVTKKIKDIMSGQSVGQAPARGVNKSSGD
jgi:hypothetical protein